MKKGIKVVVFGDSITEAVIGLSPEQRWTLLLENKLNGHSKNIDWFIVNSGVGGNTSREGLARIDRDVISHQPDMVLVQFGGNDAVDDKTREVSTEEYKGNLESIHNKLTDIKAEMILLTFTPVIDDWHSSRNNEKYTGCGGLDRFVELYRKVTREFALEKNLKLIDIDLALRKACKGLSPEEIILNDGVHLTAKANEIVSETIYDYLTR